MAYADEGPRTAGMMYERRGVPELKALGAYLIKVSQEIAGSGRGAKLPPVASKLPTRKAELSEWIQRLAQDDAFLENYYEKLSHFEKAAVQEIVHSGKGILDFARFRAKYGEVPQTRPSSYIPLLRSEAKGTQAKFPALSFLVASNGDMPPDLLSHLKKFVPKPKKMEVSTQAELPDQVKAYGQKETVRLVEHKTEHAALQDVLAVLQLADMGKVGASAKTGRVSQSGAEAIRRVLSHGDFYPAEMEAPDKYDVPMGPLGIRPFAWAMLLQAANLVQTGASKLELTRSGRAALKKAPHEIIANLWERWLKNKLLHELNRIEVIKGQKSAKHPLAQAEPSRRKVAMALADLKEGMWVKTDDFFNYLIAAGHGFEVVRNEWPLYINDPHYGSFGENSISWETANGRFARALLLEYAATLGLIDVALVPPWSASRDHHDLWGADDLSCLSRYDGLWALRLNSLGAWVLEQKESYVPSFLDEPSLQVHPNLEITVSGPSFSSSDALILDRICEKVSERAWRLSLPKLLLAVEEGVDIRHAITLVEERSRGDLPPSARAFFDEALSNVRKVLDRGDARLIECADASLARLLANDKRLRNLCFQAGARHIVVPRENETAFRKGVRELGYVLAKWAE
jgi:hypothetical protein